MLVIVESPYSADATRSIDDNLLFARQCMMDCVRRGEAPFLPHLLYTQSMHGFWAQEHMGETDPSSFWRCQTHARQATG
jgi:hypothetical protein